VTFHTKQRLYLKTHIRKRVLAFVLGMQIFLTCTRAKPLRGGERRESTRACFSTLLSISNISIKARRAVVEIAAFWDSCAKDISKGFQVFPILSIFFILHFFYFFHVSFTSFTHLFLSFSFIFL